MGERELREKLLKEVKRVVVKIGSSLLVEPRLGLKRGYIKDLAREVVVLRQKGFEILIVSSGAIAAGMELLGLRSRPSSISELQAVAAVGQGYLMRLYAEAFEPHGLRVGQVLLTHEDVKDRRRYLNARSTLLTMLSLGVLPIINENDSVAIEEIRFGDNDTLAALVAVLVEAGLLVILTDVEGFFLGGPEGGKLLTLVERVDKEIRKEALGPKGPLGTGGMATKVRAAFMASKAGIHTLVTKGVDPVVLDRLLRGEVVGTLFLAGPSRLTGKKRWIGFSLKPKGTLLVDQGAKEAILEKGKSLLPSGVMEVIGKFERGDAVLCVGPDGQEFAKGLVNYSSEELQMIKGRKTYEIEEILGYKYADEVIHRDNLVVF